MKRYRWILKRRFIVGEGAGTILIMLAGLSVAGLSGLDEKPTRPLQHTVASDPCAPSASYRVDDVPADVDLTPHEGSREIAPVLIKSTAPR